MKSEPILNVVFFQTSSGREPVREWLKSLDKEDRKTIGEDIKLVQSSELRLARSRRDIWQSGW